MARAESGGPDRPNAEPSTLTALIEQKGPHCLLLARHGETDWNVQARLQGQQDVPLNGRGRSQVRILAEALERVPLAGIHSSVLRRCTDTAASVARANVARPRVLPSRLLKETALGVLECELKAEQSTAELASHYAEFSRDEINYRIPGGENLHDVFARVETFFAGEPRPLVGGDCHLIVGHRNVNKMIIKHLLGLSFEEGVQIEQENQRLYVYFRASAELWSCWLEAGRQVIARGRANSGETYA